MEFSSVIFSDGVVLAVGAGKPDTKLTFRDYCERVVTVVFRGVADLTVIDEVEHEIIVKQQMRREGPLQRLALLNDDLKPIINVLFESAYVIDDTTVRIHEAAFGEFQATGKVEQTRCDHCGGLISIKALSESAWKMTCPCGKFTDTLRGI